MAELHLVSWNVNGIRAIIKKDFLKDIKEMDPDILCLQETKAQPEDARTAPGAAATVQVIPSTPPKREKDTLAQPFSLRRSHWK